MGRVTATEVRQIITLASTIEDTQVDVFINQANLFVTSVFTGDTTVSDDILKEIERNIAAHFLHALDPRESEKAINKARSKYSGRYGLRLEATSYGQNAMILDPTGKLATASGRKQASLSTMNFSYES
jgi:hypothetical protein